MSRQVRSGVLWPFVFLSMLLLFAIKASSGSKGKWGRGSVSALACQLKMDLPVFWYHGCNMWQGTAGTQVTCIFSALTSGLMLHLTSFTNTNLKVKLLRISRWWHQSIKPSMGPFWAPGHMYLCRSDTCENCLCLQGIRGKKVAEMSWKWWLLRQWMNMRLVILGNRLGKDWIGWRTV